MNSAAARAVTAACLLAVLAGCDLSLRDGLDAAALHSAALTEVQRGEPAKAVALCETALLREDVRASRAALESFERVRLLALARAGRGAELLADLQHLHGRDPAVIDAGRWMRYAMELEAAGDAEGAVELLDSAVTRHPDRAQEWIAKRESMQWYLGPALLTTCAY